MSAGVTAVHSAVVVPLALQVTTNAADTDAHLAIAAAGLPVEPLAADLEWNHPVPQQSAVLRAFLANGRRDLSLVVMERHVGGIRVRGVTRQRLAPVSTAKHHHLVDGICVCGGFGFAPASCFRVVGAPQATWHERCHAPPGCDHPQPLVGQCSLGWRVWHVVRGSGRVTDT